MGRKLEIGFWMASGFLAGIAVGWATAPRSGARVRGEARQQLTHLSRRGYRRVLRQGRDLQNRVQGAVAAAVAQVRRQREPGSKYVDANTLVDQVHSQLGRAFAADFEHVNLNAVGHTIFLHGYVTSNDERNRLIEAISGVDGVKKVRSESLRVLDDSDIRLYRGLRRVL